MNSPLRSKARGSESWGAADSGVMDEATFIAYGVMVHIKTDDSAMMTEIERRLPPGSRRVPAAHPDREYLVQTVDLDHGQSTERRFALWADRELLGFGGSIEQVGQMLEPHLRLFVAEHATEHVFVHAGAVGWGGSAMMFPGRSYAGKTTLVAALLQRGATYFSDEYAVLDTDGMLHPFAKALSLRESAKFEQHDRSVHELGGTQATEPLPIRLVVSCQYRAGVHLQLRKLTPGEGVLELLANTVSARKQPERALAVLERVVVRAPVYSGARGEVSEIIDELLDNPKKSM